MIQNPILKGFCPDPSIVRAGDDYYIAVSIKVSAFTMTFFCPQHCPSGDTPSPAQTGANQDVKASALSCFT